MMTAMAPADEALLVFSLNEQVPRRITTIAPVNEPAGYGVAMQPSAVPAMPALMISGVVPGIVAENATPPVPLFNTTGCRFAGTGDGPVTCISVPKPPRPCWEAAVADVHGSRWLRVLAPGPLLPAEAATKMPASVALRKASEVASVHGETPPPIE